MKNYVLVEDVESRPHGSHKNIIAVSTNKKLIFDKATKLSHKELESKSTWQNKVYWINVFDNKTGIKIDSLELVLNNRREETFGKVVRDRGSRDEKVVGSWYNIE